MQKLLTRHVSSFSIHWFLHECSNCPKIGVIGYNHKNTFYCVIGSFNWRRCALGEGMFRESSGNCYEAELPKRAKIRIISSVFQVFQWGCTILIYSLPWGIKKQELKTRLGHVLARAVTGQLPLLRGSLCFFSFYLDNLHLDPSSTTSPTHRLLPTPVLSHAPTINILKICNLNYWGIRKLTPLGFMRWNLRRQFMQFWPMRTKLTFFFRLKVCRHCKWFAENVHCFLVGLKRRPVRDLGNSHRRPVAPRCLSRSASQCRTF